MNKDEFNTYVRQMIRQHRELAGVKQQDIADLLGVRRPTVTQIETGEHNPSVWMLARIAEYLDLPITAFVPDGERG